jgi:hypothetical protein
VARAGLTSDRVVAEAAQLERLGVRLPSLYKHIAGMPALQRHLAVRAKTELTAALACTAVGRARGEALRAIATGYRGWAAEHPGLYSASTRAPHPEDAEDVAASEAAVRVVFDVLSGYGLETDAMIDATRTLRATLHGFVMLEREGGFAMDRSVDTSFTWMVAMLDAELARRSSAPAQR